MSTQKLFMVDILRPHNEYDILLCFCIQSSMYFPFNKTIDKVQSIFPEDYITALKQKYPKHSFEIYFNYKGFTDVLFDLTATIMRIYGKGINIHQRLLYFGKEDQDNELKAYIMRKYPAPENTLNRIFYTYPGNFLALVNYISCYQYLKYFSN